MGGGGVDGGGRGWRNTNTSANFGLLYACWELAGPEREREKGGGREWIDEREMERRTAEGDEKGRNQERKGEGGELKARQRRRLRERERRYMYIWQIHSTACGGHKLVSIYAGDR